MSTVSDSAVAVEAASDIDELTDTVAKQASASHWDDSQPALDDVTSVHSEQLKAHDGMH